jgi:hypothetical protein
MHLSQYKHDNYDDDIRTRSFGPGEAIAKRRSLLYVPRVLKNRYR